MQTNLLTLIIEVSSQQYIFAVCKNLDNNNIKLIHKHSVPIQELADHVISDLDLACNKIKKNIYEIEQKFETVFKETIIIINDFECSLINISGYKKLNGSQLDKENVTYLINSLKSKINEIEGDKKVVHIFNSKFILDKKNIENLPIGLFGNFYSHELSFFLMNENNYKNIRNIFNKCNLKIKKILSKSFIEGANLIDKSKDLDTFFIIKVNQKNSQIIYFENSALKFVEKFNFGSDIVIQDISKIINFNYEDIKNILVNVNFSEKNLDIEFLEKKYFKDKNYRKIKKKLLLDIAEARIQEIAEKIIIKNINLKSFLIKDSQIYLYLDDDLLFKKFRDNYKFFFSNDNKYNLSLNENSDIESFYENANKIVQFGWKKEAVPVIHEKRSIIARFFDLIFN